MKRLVRLTIIGAGLYSPWGNRWGVK